MTIKQKIILSTSVLVLFIFGASQGILYMTNKLNSYFNHYEQNAVKGKMCILYIAKDLNYISRSNRDIMLGGEYEKNIQIIKTAIANINKNFSTLENTITSKEQKLFNNTKKTTLDFVNKSFALMKTLKNKSNKEKYEVYKQYKTKLTNIAIESRKYFKEMGKRKNESFDNLTTKFYDDIKAQKKFISVTTVLVIFVFIIIAVAVLQNILKQLRLSKNLNETNNLFKQYKQAIDITSIVSKTDAKGIITYVNDEFCKVSKYSKKELLGKPHNIIRSDDAPKKLFENLWNTIQNKQVWSGIVKNKKKDGTHYFVDTTIVPILDNDKNIKEYIAIRKNITDIIELNLELTKSQEEILTRMGMIAETRSKETGNHVKRVAEYCKIIASNMDMDEEDIELLYNASALHDIGKVATPDHILHKPGRLTTDEFDTMKMHTTCGYEMLKDSKNEIVKTGGIIAQQHHEKYDGSGYPKGLKGDDIHVFARITALADVFDALGETRSYKQGWKISEIIDFINEQKGKHFDPQIVDIFNDNIQHFLYIRKKFKNPNN